jgi:mRNA interferase YafQ
MLTPAETTLFRKDLKRVQKRGKVLQKLKAIILLLLAESPLPLKNKDHGLIGNWIGHRECHIEPDWLLIYRIDADKKELILERTGTHTDLFE